MINWEIKYIYLGKLVDCHDLNCHHIESDNTNSYYDVYIINRGHGSEFSLADRIQLY